MSKFKIGEEVVIHKRTDDSIYSWLEVMQNKIGTSGIIRDIHNTGGRTFYRMDSPELGNVSKCYFREESLRPLEREWDT